jgi:hypothetical protein
MTAQWIKFPRVNFCYFHLQILHIQHCDVINASNLSTIKYPKKTQKNQQQQKKKKKKQNRMCYRIVLVHSFPIKNLKIICDEILFSRSNAYGIYNSQN